MYTRAHGHAHQHWGGLIHAYAKIKHPLPADDVGVALTFGSGDCAQLGHGDVEKFRERKKPKVLPLPFPSFSSID